VKKGRVTLKQKVLILALAVLLIGCYTNINRVKDKWGPPAKVEYGKDTIVYYYYFSKGEVRAGGDWVGGYVVVEITTDPNGKILKKRKYWKQPTATVGKLTMLNLKMTKREVISAIGEPTVARRSIVNKYDQTIDIWEYALYESSADVLYKRPAFYWLYFCDGNLVQWGEAGDWEKEADRIYEMRFR